MKQTGTISGVGGSYVFIATRSKDTEIFAPLDQLQDNPWPHIGQRVEFTLYQPHQRARPVARNVRLVA